MWLAPDTTFLKEPQFRACPDQRVSLWVADDDVPSLVVHLISVSRWRGSREPARFRLHAQPTFQGLAQVVDVLLGHANSKYIHTTLSGSSRKLGSGASREVGVLHHGGHRV